MAARANYLGYAQPFQSVAEAHAANGCASDSMARQLISKLVSGPRACLWLLFLIAATGACALEPTTPLASYGRQTWVMENGLPQNTVQVLLQTRDGFLWLGTEAGLVRFDGVGFEVFDKGSSPTLPGNDIHALLESRDGALWIGTSEGLARWKNGATLFTTKEGLPDNDVLQLSQLDDGTVRIWTSGGPADFAGERIEALKNADGYPRTALPLPGEHRDRILFSEPLAEGMVATGGRGSLTLARGKNSARATTLATGKDLPGSRIQTVVADHQGALWIGTNGGLVRWAAGKLERFPRHRSAGVRFRPERDGRPRRQCLGGDGNRRPAYSARPAFQGADRARWPFLRQHHDCGRRTARARCGWAPAAAA